VPGLCECRHLTGFAHFLETVPYDDYISLTHQDQPLAAFLILDSSNRHLRVDYIDKILFKYRIYGGNSSGSIQTAHGAIDSARRALATISGTSFLLRQNPFFAEEARRQELLLARAHYLYGLYTHENFVVIVDYFIKAMPVMGPGRVVAELVRILLVYSLGLSNFLRVKRALTRYN
jgi:hypothetical protein